MSIEGRLTRLEQRLTPTQRIRAWLTEAHAHDDLESYVRHQLAESDQGPLDVLASETRTGVRASMRGEPPDAVAAAIDHAVCELVFRFQLVLRINLVIGERLEHEAVVGQLLESRIMLANLEHQRVTRQRLLIAEADGRVRDLTALDRARQMAEARSLDGQPALFPAVRRAWEAVSAAAQELASGDPGDKPRPARRRRPHSALPDSVLVNLVFVEPARTAALQAQTGGTSAVRSWRAWLAS